MDFCHEPMRDPAVMDDRVRAFIEDRSTEVITGPRRYGRSELVEFVAGVARTMGLRIYDGVASQDSPQLIILDHWSEIKDHRDVIDANPDADVMYGQDLCHQVPAVVRFNPVKD